MRYLYSYRARRSGTASQVGGVGGRCRVARELAAVGLAGPRDVGAADRLPEAVDLADARRDVGREREPLAIGAQREAAVELARAVVEHVAVAEDDHIAVGRYHGGRRKSPLVRPVVLVGQV